MSREVLIAIWTCTHGPIDSAIKFFTHGRGTHAAFVRGNGRIAENFWPHVRERDWKPGESRHVHLFRIEGATKHDWRELECWIDKELAKPRRYSIRDLLRYAFNRPPVRGRSGFCSMWVLRGIRLSMAPRLQPLTRLEYEDFASPRDLRISPKLIPVV